MLRETESKDEGIYLLGPRTRLRCFKDMVFIAQPGKGFYLEIFNQQAKKLRVINKKIAQIKSKPKHRKRFLDAVIDALGQRRINRLKRLTKFHLKPIPGYLPVIKNFWVADNKIYIKTNDITDEKDKYFILDLKGKILKTVWLPKAYLRRSIFFNNCYYYLVDTDEGWQLYCKKV